MCGFLFLVHQNRTIDKNQFIKMGDLLQHRGPDNTSNFFINEKIGLNVSRLRIHDKTSSSDQPFKSDCGRYIILFNGAIFNFKKLKKELESLGESFSTISDTEVLLKGYLKFGNNFFYKINGMYAIAIFDNLNLKLNVFRDFSGIKPVYYFHSGETLIISSEIKPILFFIKNKKLNSRILLEFFSFQSVSAPNTFFKDVKALEPNTLLSCFCEKIKKIKLERIIKKNSYLQTNNEIDKQNEILKLFKENIKNCWFNDRKTGLLLSGGVDSGLILSISHKLLKEKNFPTFSIIFNDEKIKYYKPRSEEKIIDYFLKKYNVQNEKFLFTDCEIKESFPQAIYFNEAPLVGASSVLYFLLAKKIKKRVNVLLSGEGVDDIFNGYWNDFNFTNNLTDNLFFFNSEKMLKKIFNKSYLKENFEEFYKIFNKKKISGNTLHEKLSNFSLNHTIQGLLLRLDKMFMSNGIETRPPFLTREIIDLRFMLKDDDIYYNSNGKFIIKTLAKKFYMKQSIFKPKIGFSSPFGDWLSDKNVWNEYLNELSYDFLEQFFDVNFLKKSLEEIKNQKWKGPKLNYIMSIVNFQMFYNVFFTK